LQAEGLGFDPPILHVVSAAQDELPTGVSVWSANG